MTRAWQAFPKQPPSATGWRMSMVGSPLVTLQPPSRGTDGAISRFDLATLTWQSAVLPAAGFPPYERITWLGDRLVLWSGIRAAKGGPCPPPQPGQPMCDPIPDEPAVPQPTGAMLIPKWTP